MLQSKGTGSSLCSLCLSHQQHQPASVSELIFTVRVGLCKSWVGLCRSSGLCRSFILPRKLEYIPAMKHIETHWNTITWAMGWWMLVSQFISCHLQPGEVCVRRRSLRTEVQATVRATQLLEAHLTNGPRMAIGCHWAIHGHYFATHDMPWLIIHYSWPLGFDFSHVTTC